jgi:predicted RNA-binding Zn-ribbon protein involved in translation (DUF1610 family)
MSKEIDSYNPLPTCPSCGATLEYARINVAESFNCPACGNQLMVSERYTKIWRRISTVLTLLSLLALGTRNLYLLFLAPVVLVIIGAVGSIVIKRIYPPPIEDVLARSKEARYTPL